MIVETPNGLNKRWKRKRGLKKNDRVPDPTPLEIQRRAALLRTEWDDDTRLKRAGMDPHDLEVHVTEIGSLAGRHGLPSV
ncbi:MAG: hypothetical protein ACYC0X_00085 [Pirellulaceae bacterium]